MSRSKGESSAAPRERQGDVCRVDAPGARRALDDGLFTGVADIGRLARYLRAGGAGDAERREPAVVAVPDGSIEVDGGQFGRVDALGEVPVALSPRAARNRDVPAEGQGLKHPGDVAVVRPARRRPRLDARVGDVAGEQRAILLQQREDVAAEGLVRLEPRCDAGVHLAITDLGDHGWQVTRRPDVGDRLDEGSVVLDGPGQVGGVVGRAEPAPQDEVGARCDGRGGVDLQEREAVDDVNEVGRARRGEQLRVDGDPAGFVLGQTVDDHAAEPSGSLSRPYR